MIPIEKMKAVKFQITYKDTALWPLYVPYADAMAIVERINQGLDGVLIIRDDSYGVSAERTIRLSIEDIVVWPYAEKGQVDEWEDEDETSCMDT